MSPTALTLRHLRRLGWTAAVVERWHAHARVRQDLFGFADVIAVKGMRPRCPGGILAVQCTSATNHASRVAKVTAAPALAVWLQAGGRCEVWSWSKRSVARGGPRRWLLRTTVVTLADVRPAPR
jgi:hypothetical protein